MRMSLLNKQSMLIVALTLCTGIVYGTQEIIFDNNQLMSEQDYNNQPTRVFSGGTYSLWSTYNDNTGTINCHTNFSIDCGKTFSVCNFVPVSPTSSTITISGNAAIAPNSKLLTNKIDPINTITGLEDDTQTTTFSGNVAVSNSKTLYVDKIIPVGLSSTITNSFTGNVAIAFNKKLLVNTIDPISLITGLEDDMYTTTFSGNVTFQKPVTFITGRDGLAQIGLTDAFPAANTFHTLLITVTTSFGFENTYIGYDAGNTNTVGAANTGVGSRSLRNVIHYSGSQGGDNTGVGAGTLRSNTIGFENTGMGSFALRDTTTGSDNTGYGRLALAQNVGGFNNTAVGYFAGFNLVNGSNNLYVSNQGVSGETRTVRIGDVQTKCFISGIRNALITDSTVLINASNQLGTLVSSEKYKKDIRDMGSATDGLMKLRPVTFVYKSDETKAKHYGLIAEEVAEVYPELVVYSQNNDPETVCYHELSPMLLNGHLRQQKQIDEIVKTISDLVLDLERSEK